MNKYRLFVFLAVATVASAIEPQNQLREGVLKIIENWRQGSGSLPIAIEPLPLKFPVASCTYDGYKMTVENLQINGLENLSVTLSVNERVQSMTFYLNVNVPTVTIQTGWAVIEKVGGWFSGFFSDSGVLSGQINNVWTTAGLEIGLQGSNAVVKSLSLDLSVDDHTLYISGATFDYYTNKKLKEKVSKMVRNKDFSCIRNKIINAVNNYFQGQTPDQLIAKIKAYA